MSLKTEFAVMGIKDLVRSNPSVMRTLMLHPALHNQCPEIIDFATKNEIIFK